MISQGIEKLILEDKAVCRVLNIGSGIFNYNSGKNSKTIIHNIHVHNTLSNSVEFADIDPDPIKESLNINQAIERLLASCAIFTINIYDSEKEFNLTIKNKINISVSESISGGTYLIGATSVLDFNKDLFFVFKGQNVIFEITEVRNTLNFLITENLTPYELPEKKTDNPIGFELPNSVYTSYSGGDFDWSARQMGKQTTQQPGGTLCEGFNIPRSGTGALGNTINNITFTPLLNQFIMNIGIIELNN